MSLVYNFNYNDRAYAGLSATVVDQVSGGEVAGSPVTLDENGNGSLSLAEGFYLATVSNLALGKSSAATNGVLDVPDSIIDAGGGGGGIITNGPVYTLEYLAGTAEIADQDQTFHIPFDNISDEITDLGEQVYDVPEGIYVLNYDIEPNKAAEDRTGRITFVSGDTPDLNSTVLPILMIADSWSFHGSIYTGQRLISGGHFSVGFELGSAAGGGDPLTLGYAIVTLTKIA